jgi:mannose-6-phosphate isomerase-like protein (cupin superfamily)
MRTLPLAGGGAAFLRPKVYGLLIHQFRRAPPLLPACAMKRKATTTSGAVQGAVQGAEFTGKMTVDQLAAAGTPEDAATRRRLAAASYTIPPDAAVEVIHCDKGRGILANGFKQVFADVDGQRCRILDYAPTQSLQPHYHNADELFVIGGGRIKVFKWPDIAALTAGDPPAAVEWLGKGDTLAIPAGVPHCIHGHPETGVAFHELVGNFGARTTDFVKAEVEAHNPVPRASSAIRPMLALGDDGELRSISAEVRERFCERSVLIAARAPAEDDDDDDDGGLELVRQLVGAGATVIVACPESLLKSKHGHKLEAAARFGAKGSCVVPWDASDTVASAARTLSSRVAQEVLLESPPVGTKASQQQPLDFLVELASSSSSSGGRGSEQVKLLVDCLETEFVSAERLVSDDPGLPCLPLVHSEV